MPEEPDISHRAKVAIAIFTVVVSLAIIAFGLYMASTTDL